MFCLLPSTDLGNTEGMWDGKYTELSRAQTKLLGTSHYLCSTFAVWRCVPRLMQFSNFSYLLSLLFTHLGSRLYFPNLSRAALNDRSFATHRLSPVAAHLFLIIQADTINQSINRFWVTDLNLVQTDCESARLCEVIWPVSLLLKHHFSKKPLNFHQLQFFFSEKNIDERLRTFFIFPC